MTWTARVTEPFSAAHHNGPEGHRCRTNHGHDWLAIIEIQYGQLDELGWGPDFGALKKLVKSLDHQDLNELLDFPPSAENIAKWLYDETTAFVSSKLAYVRFVEIHEGDGNVVVYRGDDFVFVPHG